MTIRKKTTALLVASSVCFEQILVIAKSFLPLQGFRKKQNHILRTILHKHQVSMNSNKSNNHKRNLSFPVLLLKKGKIVYQ